MLAYVTSAFSQIDLNRCKVNEKLNFPVNVLKITDAFFIHQAYSVSTLYVSKIHGAQDITILNGSPQGIKLIAIDTLKNNIAIVDHNKSVKIVNHKTETVLKEFTTGTSIVSAIFWFKEYLFLGMENGDVKVHSLDSEEVKTFKLHTSAIIDFKMIENVLYTVSHDKYLKKSLYNGKFKTLEEVNLEKTPTVFDIKDNKIVVGTFNGHVLVLDSKNLDILNLKTKNSKILVNTKDYVMNFDYNSNKLAYSTRNGELVYRNLNCNSNNELSKILEGFK